MKRVSGIVIPVIGALLLVFSGCASGPDTGQGQAAMLKQSILLPCLGAAYDLFPLDGDLKIGWIHKTDWLLVGFWIFSRMDLNWYTQLRKRRKQGCGNILIACHQAALQAGVSKWANH